MSKLPYIPDKNLYSAVMFACKMIRENGYFNKDIKNAASYYGVNPEDVEKYVRIAQGNGQKAANAKKAPRKYHWYAVEWSMGSGEESYFMLEYAEYGVAKGISKKTVKERMTKRDDIWEERPCHYFGRIEQFETENDAYDCIESWEAQQKRLSEGLTSGQLEELVREEPKEPYFSQAKEILDKQYGDENEVVDIFRYAEECELALKLEKEAKR